MSPQKIEPSKINKPIQLLAAWLVGLVLVNGSFLGSAALIQKPEWLAATLVIAAIANVPIFLICVFLLQTKFRPQMQDDEFYSKYLEKSYSPETGKMEIVNATLECNPISSTRKMVAGLVRGPELPIPKSANQNEQIEVQINDLLPNYRELFFSLNRQGIHLMNTFGSTSAQPNPPDEFIITTSSGVKKEYIQKIIKIAKDFGLKGVGMIPREMRTSEEEQVFIGSYAFKTKDRPFLKMTPEIIEKLLSPRISDEDFWALFPKPN
jgi:hypothetical protein